MVRLFHFLFLFARRRKFYKSFRRGVKALRKTCELKPLTKQQKKEIFDYYKKTMNNKPKLYWHQLYYSVNGTFAKEYVPMDWYYGQIQPRLFDMRVCIAYDDKNLYDQLFPNVYRPRTILKCHNGHYFDSTHTVIAKTQAFAICENLDEAIIKPTYQSAGGEGVCKFSVKDGVVQGTSKKIESFLGRYGKNYIIQEVIHQHESLKKLNPSSVNTIRVLTYFREDQVIVLYAVMRIGEQGSVVDNTSHGGYNCKIHDGGYLDRYAYSFNPVHRSEKSQSGVVFEGYQIPSYSRVIDEARRCHTWVAQIPLIGWDFTVDESGNVILIEMNAPCGLELSQMAAGPAFGKYTDEILKKSVFKNKFFLFK